VASLGVLLPDLTAVVSGLEKSNVNDSFQVERAAALYEKLYPSLEPAHRRARTERPMDLAVERREADLGRVVLDLMSIGHLVSDRDASALGLVCVSGDSDTVPKVWKNPTSLPRAYVVPRAFLTDDDPAHALHLLLTGNPRERVLITADPLAPGPRQPFTPARWIGRGQDEVIVRVETQAPGLLVVANTWMPGWAATVDGAPGTVLRGNHCQQVVAIPSAGSHEIILRYQPPGFVAGLSVTLASLAGWGGVGLACLFRSPRRPASAPSRPHFKTPASRRLQQN
jgi:hypothetical protein